MAQARSLSASELSQSPARSRPLSGRLARLGSRAALYAMIVIGAIFCLLPFTWQLSTALKTARDALVFPPIWMPNPIQWGNFVASMTIPGLPFGTFFANTIIITTLALTGNMVAAPIVAYSLARLRWPGRNQVFALVLATIMLPQQVTIIPQFILFKYFGWV
ncbi:MAG: carbohydrate ABC transporter permease, partial [Chloroflexi bacterium]|nr:carbohydrate ABC transporter permease [Chloroflexota bacterium]